MEICEAKIVRGWHSGRCDKKARWSVRIVKGDMSFPWTVMDIGDNRKEVNFCGTHKNQVMRWESRIDGVVCEVKEIKKEDNPDHGHVQGIVVESKQKEQKQ